MSLIPSFAQSQNRSADGTSTYDSEGDNTVREWGVDFNSGQLTGELVSGKKAIKAWIWKAMMTERFRYAIYSWNYGSELDSYIGKYLTEEYRKTDIKLALEDTLLVNENITEIRNYKAELKKDVLYLSFTAVTKFGEISVLDFNPERFVSSTERAKDKAILILKANTAKFYITPSGRLMWKRTAAFDRSAKFARTDSGRLLVKKTKEFDEAVEMKRSGESLEVTFNV